MLRLPQHGDEDEECDVAIVTGVVTGNEERRLNLLRKKINTDDKKIEENYTDKKNKK